MEKNETKKSDDANKDLQDEINQIEVEVMEQPKIDNINNCCRKSKCRKIMFIFERHYR